MARPARPKYEPLRAFLAGQPADVAELTLTLAEIEALLRAPLPTSAWLTAYWTNVRAGAGAAGPAGAWLAAGWRVAAPPRGRGRPAVTFVRADTTPEPFVSRRPPVRQGARERRRGGGRIV